MQMWSKLLHILNEIHLKIIIVGYTNYCKISTVGPCPVFFFVFFWQNHNVKCNGRKHQDSPNVRKRTNEVSHQQTHFISLYIYDYIFHTSKIYLSYLKQWQSLGREMKKSFSPEDCKITLMQVCSLLLQCLVVYIE